MRSALRFPQRCWHDVEDIPPQADQYDPLMRALQHGEAGVSWFPNGRREILPETELFLIDRIFQPGDLCKRRIDDVRAGVIADVLVRSFLSHSVSNVHVPQSFEPSEIVNPPECDIGDYVVYNDWIGQVCMLPMHIHLKTYYSLGGRGILFISSICCVAMTDDILQR